MYRIAVKNSLRSHRPQGTSCAPDDDHPRYGPEAAIWKTPIWEQQDQQCDGWYQSSQRDQTLRDAGQIHTAWQRKGGTSEQRVIGISYAEALNHANEAYCAQEPA